MEERQDLINRQAAIDIAKDLLIQMEEYHQFNQAINNYCAELVKLPPVQPEIVRCKDCKYRASYWGNCRLLEEKYHQSVPVDGDGFCSMAERRTDGVDCCG